MFVLMHRRIVITGRVCIYMSFFLKKDGVCVCARVRPCVHIQEDLMYRRNNNFLFPFYVCVRACVIQ